MHKVKVQHFTDKQAGEGIKYVKTSTGAKDIPPGGVSHLSHTQKKHLALAFVLFCASAFISFLYSKSMDQWEKLLNQDVASFSNSPINYQIDMRSITHNLACHFYIILKSSKRLQIKKGNARES